MLENPRLRGNPNSHQTSDLFFFPLFSFALLFFVLFFVFSSFFELARYCPHSSRRNCATFVLENPSSVCWRTLPQKKKRMVEGTPGEGSGSRNPLISTSTTRPPWLDSALLLLRGGWKVAATSAVLHLRLRLREHGSVLFSESISQTDLEMCAISLSLTCIWKICPSNLTRSLKKHLGAICCCNSQPCTVKQLRSEPA